MNQYKILEHLDPDQWRDFLRRHPRGHYFQGPAVFRLFEKTRNHWPVILGVGDDGGTIRGILSAVVQKESAGIKGYFSSRAVVWGGPLVDAPGGDTGEAAQHIAGMLLDHLLHRIGRGTIYVQFRNLWDMQPYLETFQSRGFQYHDHLNYIVDTTQRKETEKHISKSKMRQVRQSLRNGARLVEPTNIQQVRDFYDILLDLYRTRVKRPLPDWSFFEAFYRQNHETASSASSEPTGKYLLVEYQGNIIGGIMCPILGSIIYEWYVCGRDGHHKGVYPSVLATWAAIDYALEHRLTHFDFMGAGKPGVDSGVREFKARFGGNLVRYGRFERINNKPLYALGKLGLKLLGGLKK